MYHPLTAGQLPDILVTGGTGFLGTHVVGALIQARGGPAGIRVLARRPSLRMEQLGVQVVQGDVTSAEACAQALHQVHEVYHLAGRVSHLDADATEMTDVHVGGTRTLLQAARSAKVRRVVLVSSSGTVGVSPDTDEVSDESSPYRLKTVARWPYYVAKINQEQLALHVARNGALDVVVVSPSMLLGPGDLRGASTADVQKVVRGRLPVVPRGGGVAFVDVRDAARGCLLAMERGRAGTRYLLSSANMTLENFVGRVAHLACAPVPRALEAPHTMRAAGWVVRALSRRLGTTPPFELRAIEMAEHTWYVSARRAHLRLGWRCRDPQITLADTVRDILARMSPSQVAAGFHGATSETLSEGAQP